MGGTCRGGPRRGCLAGAPLAACCEVQTHRLVRRWPNSYFALRESCVSVHRPLLGDTHLHMLVVSWLSPVHKKLLINTPNQPARLKPMCQG